MEGGHRSGAEPEASARGGGGAGAGRKRGRDEAGAIGDEGEGGRRLKKGGRPQRVRTKAIVVARPRVQRAREARAHTTRFHALTQREAILETALRS
jgi:hypothetical protein